MTERVEGLRGKVVDFTKDCGCEASVLFAWVRKLNDPKGLAWVPYRVWFQRNLFCAEPHREVLDTLTRKGDIKEHHADQGEAYGCDTRDRRESIHAT